MALFLNFPTDVIETIMLALDFPSATRMACCSQALHKVYNKLLQTNHLFRKQMSLQLCECSRKLTQANENARIAEKERILATIKRTVKESLIVLWLAKHEWNVNEFDAEIVGGLYLKQHFPCKMYNLPGRVFIDLEGPHDNDLEGPAIGATIGEPFPPGSRYIFSVWITDIYDNWIGDDPGYDLTIDATGQELDQSVHRLFSGEEVLGDAFNLFEALATRAADAYAEFNELDQAAAAP